MNWIRLRNLIGTAFLFYLSVIGRFGWSEDWPMYGKDAQRSAVYSNVSIKELISKRKHLRWVRELPPPGMAGGVYGIMGGKDYSPDLSYEPVVMDEKVFIASMVNDSLTAFDLNTGEKKWRFFADGPIRLAPVGWNGKVYAGSDDGRLYCLNAADGKLIWKFSGAPRSLKAIGRDRLVSAWPVRGGPVVAGNRVYFGCGLWPSMGIFIYALDAETGKKVWVNDGSSALTVSARGKMKWQPGKVDPVGSLAMASGVALTGVTAYGYLSVNELDGERVLVVPSAMNRMPSLFDLETGKLIYCSGFFPSRGGTSTAFTEYARSKDRGKAIDVRFGKYIRKFIRGNPPAKKWMISGSGKDAEPAEFRSSGKKQKLPTGIVSSLLPVGEKLIAVTLEGRLYCFGGTPDTAHTYQLKTETLNADDKWKAVASKVLEKVKPLETYCLVLGLDDGGLVRAVLEASSNFRVIAVDTNAAKVDALRREFDAARLYGSRVAIHVGDPIAFEFPRFTASLVLSPESINGIGSGISFSLF